MHCFERSERRREGGFAGGRGNGRRPPEPARPSPEHHRHLPCFLPCPRSQRATTAMGRPLLAGTRTHRRPASSCPPFPSPAPPIRCSLDQPLPPALPLLFVHDVLICKSGVCAGGHRPKPCGRRGAWTWCTSQAATTCGNAAGIGSWSCSEQRVTCGASMCPP